MNEQAKVGLVVVISAAVFTTAVFYMLNLGVGKKYTDYKMYLKFAGGLEPGGPVRYGGLKVGRVKSLRVDPQDNSRIEIRIQVSNETPVRTDSVASLSQLGMLGENYVEIQPGKAASVLPAGSTIPSAETQDLAALMRKMNALMEQAQPLVADLHKNLNQVTAQVDAVLVNLQDVTGPANRAHLASVMRETDEMVKRNAPRIDAIAANMQNATAKIDPLVADLRTTSAKLDRLITQLNGVVDENRKDIQASIAQLSKTLDSTRELIGQLNNTMTSNSENVDAIMVNMRTTSENLSDLSDTLKQRPFSLIRIAPKPDRQVPGEAKQSKRAGKPAGSNE